MKATKTRNIEIEAVRLAKNKVISIGNIISYALTCLFSLNLNREAAENFGRSNKAVSPTFFNT
jgi:hypothetical protein